MNNDFQKALSQLNTVELSALAGQIISELTQSNKPDSVDLEYSRDSTLFDTSQNGSASLDPYFLLNAIREIAAYPSSGGGFPGTTLYSSGSLYTDQNSGLLSVPSAIVPQSVDGFPAMQPPHFVQSDMRNNQQALSRQNTRSAGLHTDEGFAGSYDSPNSAAAYQPNAQMSIDSESTRQQNTLMSAVSEFFRRDSRRYDGGFERY